MERQIFLSNKNVELETIENIVNLFTFYVFDNEKFYVLRFTFPKYKKM